MTSRRQSAIFLGAFIVCFAMLTGVGGSLLRPIAWSSASPVCTADLPRLKVVRHFISQRLLRVHCI